MTGKCPEPDSVKCVKTKSITILTRNRNVMEFTLMFLFSTKIQCHLSKQYYTEFEKSFHYQILKTSSAQKSFFDAQNLMRDCIKSMENTKSNAVMVQSTISQVNIFMPRIPSCTIHYTIYFIAFWWSNNNVELPIGNDENSKIYKIDGRYIRGRQHARSNWDRYIITHTHTQRIQTICNFAIGDFYVADF